MLKMYKLAYAISRHTKKAADHYKLRFIAYEVMWVEWNLRRKF
jgi:hypothetical protein